MLHIKKKIQLLGSRLMLGMARLSLVKPAPTAAEGMKGGIR